MEIPARREAATEIATAAQNAGTTTYRVAQELASRVSTLPTTHMHPSMTAAIVESSTAAAAVFDDLTRISRVHIKNSLLTPYDLRQLSKQNLLLGVSLVDSHPPWLHDPKLVSERTRLEDGEEVQQPLSHHIRWSMGR